MPSNGLNKIDGSLDPNNKQRALQQDTVCFHSSMSGQKLAIEMFHPFLHAFAERTSSTGQYRIQGHMTGDPETTHFTLQQRYRLCVFIFKNKDNGTELDVLGSL